MSKYLPFGMGGILTNSLLKKKKERGHRKHCLTLLQHDQHFDKLSCNVKDSRRHRIPMPLNKQITEDSQHL